MFEPVYSMMEDVKQCLELAEKINSASLREAIIAASRDALADSAELLPKKKRYVLPKSPTLRAKYTPWTPAKSDLNAFRSEMLIFLRERFPERNPKANMAEVPKLWMMYKDAGSLKEILECAKSAVVSETGRLRSMSEESV